MCRGLAAALVAAVLFLASGDARADRVQLPSDPQVMISVGTGTFFGHSSRYDFRRIQPTYLRLELQVFNRGLDCHWLCRLNAYGSLNPESNGLGYTDDLSEVTLKDKDGNDVVAHKSGVLGASLDSGIMWSWGIGGRLSIYDSEHFHLEAFGEYSTSISTQTVNVEHLDVHALLTHTADDGSKIFDSEFDLDATGLAKQFGTVTFNWGMKFVGLNAAFPFRSQRLSNHRLTPFITAGFIWFDSDVGLKVDKSLLDQLAAFGVKSDDIPTGKQVRESSPTLSIGARFEVNRNNAFEFNGTFIHTGAVTAYWMTGSYSVRFDLW